MCISSTNVFNFFMLHTQHITYWLLYNVQHELIIKCYGPSCTQTASAPYLVIPKSPKIPWRWHLYQSGASATTCWQRYQCIPKHWAGRSKFTSFREQSFDQWFSQADFIFFTFSTEILLGYVKHTLNFAVSLRGIFCHWVGTDMPCWLWLTFEMDRTAIEQSLH